VQDDVGGVGMVRFECLVEGKWDFDGGLGSNEWMLVFIKEVGRRSSFHFDGP
jgi:hypothetical protein